MLITCLNFCRWCIFLSNVPRWATFDSFHFFTMLVDVFRKWSKYSSVVLPKTFLCCDNIVFRACMKKSRCREQDVRWIIWELVAVLDLQCSFYNNLNFWSWWGSLWLEYETANNFFHKNVLVASGNYSEIRLSEVKHWEMFFMQRGGGYFWSTMGTIQAWKLRNLMFGGTKCFAEKNMRYQLDELT